MILEKRQRFGLAMIDSTAASGGGILGLALVAEYLSVKDRTRMPIRKSTHQMGSSERLPVEVVHLLEVLERIEWRRQTRLRVLVEEGRD